MPNSYNADDLSSLSMSGYVWWYRKDFTLPTSGAFSRYVPSRFRHWILRFDSVNYRATVWLNGRRLGSHAGAYLPFEFDLKGLRPGVNRLIVRVDNRRTPADLPPGPVGGWWNFGGILGDVYVRTAQRVDISQVQVRPVQTCPSCAATIEDQALVRNVTGVPQTVSLTGTYGRAKLDFGSATIAPMRPGPHRPPPPSGIHDCGPPVTPTSTTPRSRPSIRSAGSSAATSPTAAYGRSPSRRMGA